MTHATALRCRLATTKISLPGGGKHYDCTRTQLPCGIVCSRRNDALLHDVGRLGRCYSTAASSDGLFSQEEEPQKLLASLETYSRYQPCPVSIAHFLEFGRSKSVESSFRFLRREVPVRIANIMKELQLMPKELRTTRGCSVVMEQYAQSFKELTAYEQLSSKDEAVLKDFTASLTTARERHGDTVIAMAEAVMELKINEKQKRSNINANFRPKFVKNIQYFLDRLYTSRISTRMLINQHTMLFDDHDSTSKIEGHNLNMVGTIDPSCEVVPIVEQAYDSARFLCEQYYLSAPQMVFSSYDGSRRNVSPPSYEIAKEGRQDKVSFVYVPSHMYHILFELFKNAMRATIESAGEDAIEFEPIKVYVVKGREDVTIKICDRGGGIPRSLRNRIFEYLYTTAPNPILTNSAEINDVSSMISGPGGLSGIQTAPLAGLGYGLPLSRLYARYFGGDLEVYSAEAWGTDAVIYLPALAGEAKERLPIYHEAGSRKIYEAQLTASDWTMSNEREVEGRGGKHNNHEKDFSDL